MSPRGILRAGLTYVATFGRRKEGASTLTMQLVRTVTAKRQKQLNRKLKEIVLARKLEKAYKKKQIFEAYANEVYFGGGRYGTRQASLAGGANIGAQQWSAALSFEDTDGFAPRTQQFGGIEIFPQDARGYRNLSGKLQWSTDLGGWQLGGWESFWILFYSFATYGNAGFMREQVCKYMCPYARFQSAMFDRDTLIITYDAERGEPRGGRKKGVDPRSRGLGDCTDCTLCVQVCPTGIDIRKGLQYECIACASCIDACDAVMDKVGLPRGLIRYSTQNEMDGAGTHVVRPRVLLYGLGLALLLVGFFVAVSVRSLVDLDVLRDRNALYRELNDGRIENVFTVRIINKDQHAHEFVLEPRGLPGAQIDTDSPRQRVAPEEVKTVVVRVRAEQHDRHGGQDFVVLAQATDDPKLTAKSRARFFFEP